MFTLEKPVSSWNWNSEANQENQELRFTGCLFFLISVLFFGGFKHKRNLTAPERRVDRMSLADASSGASDDTAVTGAIFLRGPSPTEGHVTPGEEKPGCGHAHRL